MGQGGRGRARVQAEPRSPAASRARAGRGAHPPPPRPRGPPRPVPGPRRVRGAPGGGPGAPVPLACAKGLARPRPQPTARPGSAAWGLACCPPLPPSLRAQVLPPPRRAPRPLRRLLPGGASQRPPAGHRPPHSPEGLRGKPPGASCPTARASCWETSKVPSWPFAPGAPAGGELAGGETSPGVASKAGDRPRPPGLRGHRQSCPPFQGQRPLQACGVTGLRPIPSPPRTREEHTGEDGGRAKWNHT